MDREAVRASTPTGIACIFVPTLTTGMLINGNGVCVDPPLGTEVLRQPDSAAEGPGLPPDVQDPALGSVDEGRSPLRLREADGADPLTQS